MVCLFILNGLLQNPLQDFSSLTLLCFYRIETGAQLEKDHIKLNDAGKMQFHPVIFRLKIHLLLKYNLSQYIMFFL